MHMLKTSEAASSISNPGQVRVRNFYKDGDRTHFNQLMEGVTIQKCWDQCLEEFDFANRRQAVEEFNRYSSNDVIFCTRSKTLCTGLAIGGPHGGEGPYSPWA